LDGSVIRVIWVRALPPADTYRLSQGVSLLQSTIILFGLQVRSGSAADLEDGLVACSRRGSQCVWCC